MTRDVASLRQRVRDTQEALGAAMALVTDSDDLTVAQSQVLEEAHEAWLAYYEQVRGPASPPRRDAGRD